ncbi:MAG: hypothetical protein CSA66_03845 [Proteobacteria bacterium]|nr:MAG: hypothetical protein CSA66_03845 [Pseudomonadota bacterium]
MADNTKQYGWIVLLAENLDAIREDFVAGDLLWYPVEGSPKIRVAPDVLIAPGRPKGHRGSYQQWKEAGVAPSVVVEVLSPSNSLPEMTRKVRFYDQYGVDEIIVVDPEANDGWAHARDPNGRLVQTQGLDGWQSPRLGIRFERQGGELFVRGPDGQRFERLVAHRERAERAEREAQLETERAERAEREAQLETERAERAEREAQREAARAAKLAAKLAELGIDPDTL